MLKSQKPHIGIFGRRNIGKSSLINALTGQEIAIVSPHAGTTTDPVTKTMEIIGIGPVILTDTAGIDDEGELGKKRVARTIKAIDTIDLAMIAISHNSFGEHERSVMARLAQKNIPCFIVHNKSDIEGLDPARKREIEAEAGTDVIAFSSIRPDNFEQVVALMKKHLPPTSYQRSSILSDMVRQGDVVVLVTPVDIETPEGRIILPQVQTIRELLDNNCISVVLKEPELSGFIGSCGMKPRLVVTDSQAFAKVDALVPPDIPLTSFSILYTRMKGDLEKAIEGTGAISKLDDGDRVMILESCTHHVAGDDIGRVKLPRWLSDFTGKQLSFDVVAGLDEPPRPIEEYSLVVQCGGCMLTRKQVLLRLAPAIEAKVPVTNYGLAIAWCLGVFDRAIAPFAAHHRRS
ncbi:MAG: [FeFe] hydrogenase H-cluster maturation GTPase HydF [bacterium]